MVYLDYNATAPLRPEARAAMLAALNGPGNPSSVHGFGRAARKLVEAARESIATLAGVKPDGVIFTSGATEANALALHGKTVLASAIEHSSIEPRTIPVTADGVVDLDALDRLLADAPKPALVALMAVNNETGVIQPVAQAAAIAHRHDALLHCDAVQAAGRLDLASLGADSLSLSAHKLGGPTGVGALVLRDGLEIEPLWRGGGQERRRRAGTENVAGIAGFGAVANLAVPDLAAWRDRLEAALEGEATFFGRNAPRAGNTSLIAMPGVQAATQVMAFDLDGIAVSAGAACSSGKVAPSHVLQAMGAGDLADAAVRVSLGWASLEQDVDRFVESWRRLRARTPARIGARIGARQAA